MRLLIFFLLLILTQFTSAQHSIGVGAMGAFDYTDRILKNTSDLEIIVGIYDMRQEDEASKLNYQFGLQVEKEIFDRFWIKSGFKLVSIGYYDELIEDIRWPQEFDPFTGNYSPDPSLPHQSQFHYDYMMLTIPLRAKYLLSDKKCAPFVESGFSTSYYSATRSTETTDIFKTSNFFVVEDFRKISLSFDLGIGLNFKPAEDIGLYIMPNARFYFLPLVADAAIKEYLYAFGIEAGFFKYFGKQKE